MSRLSICEHCGIYDAERKVCNGSLYINPKNNDVSVSLKEGYIRGCSCYIPSKVLKPQAKCPAGKW